MFLLILLRVSFQTVKNRERHDIRSFVFSLKCASLIYVTCKNDTLNFANLGLVSLYPESPVLNVRCNNPIFSGALVSCLIETPIRWTCTSVGGHFSFLSLHNTSLSFPTVQFCIAYTLHLLPDSVCNSVSSILCFNTVPTLQPLFGNYKHFLDSFRNFEQNMSLISVFTSGSFSLFCQPKCMRFHPRKAIMVLLIFRFIPTCRKAHPWRFRSLDRMRLLFFAFPVSVSALPLLPRVL